MAFSNAKAPLSSPSYVTMNKFLFKSTYCAIADHCGAISTPEQMAEPQSRGTKLALNCKRGRHA